MKQKIMICSIVFTMLFSAVSSAEIVQVEFSGVITRVDEGTILDGNVEVGSEFSGSYVYDDAATDVSSTEEWGIYNFGTPPYSYDLTIGNFCFSASEEYTIGLLVRDYSNTYSVSSSNVSVVQGANQWDWDKLYLGLGDPTGMALNSNALTERVVFDNWSGASIGLYPYHYGPQVGGEITSFAYVPEPGALSLLLVGGSVMLRRR